MNATYYKIKASNKSTKFKIVLLSTLSNVTFFDNGYGYKWSWYTNRTQLKAEDYIQDDSLHLAVSLEVVKTI